jgi:hypothetical protein
LFCNEHKGMASVQFEEYFCNFCNMITNDARCTREIKSRIAMAKGAFNKKKALYTSKLELNLRCKLVAYSTTFGAWC